MSLKLCTFASSSSGNCIFVSSNKTAILIDIGIPYSKLENCLSHLGVKSHLNILLTHCHNDHVLGFASLYKNTKNITIYSHRDCTLPFEDKIEVKKFDDKFLIGDIEVTPFEVLHDVPCTGYNLKNEGSSITFLTDCGTIYDDTIELIQDSDLLYIEANYDKNMLDFGRYPIHLKKRIKSSNGHLSNDDCAIISLEAAKKGRLKKIILGHLSKENNTPEKAEKTVRSFLEKNGIANIQISVAPREGRGDTISV